MNILLTEASTYWIQRLDYVNKASLIIFLISIFWWIILIIHHYIDGRDIEDLKMYKKLFLFLGVVTLMSLLILIFNSGTEAVSKPLSFASLKKPLCA